MPDEMKPVLARQMEVYAGFLEHVDYHTGRLIDAITDLGVLDNTIIYYIIGDNGASAEGTMNGAFNELANFNGMAALETPEFMAAARHELPLIGRLLGIGLPLSIVAGTAIAVLMFPSLPLALAGLIAASLAPTDAALSASVIADERLPLGVRRLLNVESGLNDGIATPVVTFCIAAAATVIGVAEHEFHSGFGAVGELTVGALVGVGIGVIGGKVISIARQRAWTEHGSRRLAALSLALLSFLVASHIGGNPFVAAFVGGLCFGAAARADAAESIEFTELTGSLLSLALWFIFGGGFVLPAFQHLDLQIALYAIASLTVVRMIPVAISLIGSGEDRATVAFVGWFGPRGLASVVFALLAVEDLGGTDPRVLTAVYTIAITIVFSIVAHGITARPLASRYVAGVTVSTE